MMLDKKQDDEKKDRSKQWEEQHNNEVHAQHFSKEASREKDLLFQNEARKLKYQEDKFNEQDKRHKEILERYQDKDLKHEKEDQVDKN